MHHIGYLFKKEAVFKYSAAENGGITIKLITLDLLNRVSLLRAFEEKNEQNRSVLPSPPENENEVVSHIRNIFVDQ